MHRILQSKEWFLTRVYDVWLSRWTFQSSHVLFANPSASSQGSFHCCGHELHVSWCRRKSQIQSEVLKTCLPLIVIGWNVLEVKVSKVSLPIKANCWPPKTIMKCAFVCLIPCMVPPFGKTNAGLFPNCVADPLVLPLSLSLFPLISSDATAKDLI